MAFDLLFRPEQLDGPLGLLARSLREKTKVLVVTRHKNGVRGVCTGLLAAFDRHFNLVLRDVDERYAILTKSAQHAVSRGGGDGAGAAADAGARGECSGDGGSTKWKRKLSYHRRHLPQILLRGESIVLVSAGGEPTQTLETHRAFARADPNIHCDEA